MIRVAGPSDVPFLRQMLFEALYVHDREEPFLRSILDEPRLRHYVEGFGEQPGDLGLIAFDGDRGVGACWLRRFTPDDPGYGWVDAEVPELSIALVPEERGKGIGTMLMERVLQEAAGRGVERVSLSVDPRSPALRLYRRSGFEEVGRQDTSITMVRSLNRS